MIILFMWVIAGFCFGWVFIDFVLVGVCKVRIPMVHNIVSGLIFSLTTFEVYTRWWL